MQVWPAPMKPPKAAPRAATSTGVSSKTSTGDLPPSSRVVLAKRCAAARAMERPGSVPPVNTTFLTSGCSVSAAPVVGSEPVDDVEDAVGDAGLVGDVGEQHRGERASAPTA